LNLLSVNTKNKFNALQKKGKKNRKFDRQIQVKPVLPVKNTGDKNLK
jgi:hypothetical protein